MLFFFFFFSSVGFWFALQIEFQSETRAARLPHGRGETCRDFSLRLKYRRGEKKLRNPVKYFDVGDTNSGGREAM